MRQITILDVLTEEGFQKFKDKGVGAKLSGTSFRADDPANNLFWGMFRQIGRMAKEADAKDEEHEAAVTAIANELAVAEDQLKHRGQHIEALQQQVLDQQARNRKLEKTIIEQALLITTLNEVINDA